MAISSRGFTSRIAMSIAARSAIIASVRGWASASSSACAAPARAFPGSNCALRCSAAEMWRGGAAALDRTLKDPLTGLGNRVSMMEELEQRSPHFADTTFALLDVDRFKSIHASLGDTGGDGILSQMAERLTKRFEGVAQVFRVGGDA